MANEYLPNRFLNSSSLSISRGTIWLKDLTAIELF